MPAANGWVLWALLSAVFAALTAIFAKVGIEGVNSDVATLIRSVIVVLVLGAFVSHTAQWPETLALPMRTWVFLALSALATGASWLCYFRALQAGDAALVASVDKFSVVLVALFAFMFLGERPTVRDWMGICLVGAGACLLVFKR